MHVHDLTLVNWSLCYASELTYINGITCNMWHGWTEVYQPKAWSFPKPNQVFEVMSHNQVVFVPKPKQTTRVWQMIMTFMCAICVCHVIVRNRLSLSMGSRVLLLEPIPALPQGEGRVLPGQVASSSQGPHWWAMWGSVSCSRTL